MTDFTPIFDLAFKGLCIAGGLIAIGSLIDSYWRALRAWKELGR